MPDGPQPPYSPQTSYGPWWDLQPGEDYAAWFARTSGTNVYARGAPSSAYNPAIPATDADPGNPDFKWQTWELDPDRHEWFYTVTSIDPQGYGTDTRYYYDPNNKNAQYQQNFQTQMANVTQMVQGGYKGEVQTSPFWESLPILLTGIGMTAPAALATLGVGAAGAAGAAEAGGGLLGTGITAGQVGAAGQLAGNAYSLASGAATGSGYDPTLALISGAVGGAIGPALGPIAGSLAKQGVSQGLKYGIQAAQQDDSLTTPTTPTTPTLKPLPNLQQGPALYQPGGKLNPQQAQALMQLFGQTAQGSEGSE